MRPYDCHILMYHHVAPKGKLDDMRPWVVYKETFARQLDMLIDMGYSSMHLKSFFDAQAPESGLMARSVVITFDDGGLDLLQYAVPELNRRALTATFFVPVGKLGGYNDWETSMGWPKVPIMDEEAVSYLSENGFEIGSHGLNHIDLSRCSREQAESELRHSREFMEDRLGISVRFFAYPYGGYPSDYADLCRSSAYMGACGISSPFKYAVQDPYALRRVLVHTGDSPLRFRLKMSRCYLKLLSRRNRKTMPKMLQDADRISPAYQIN
jgi:peptidoglycan/xylan/chitin deacetylase (PgdA/CDA1 family)